ncbi:MAG: hydrolase [Chlorobiales bacterium]|jgi:nicotinamidase-related amidase|nr:hydrolase [Chlorobiales bacterium]
MLTIENTALVVVDVQGKLAGLMYRKEDLFENLNRLIKGAQILQIPIILTEQYPKGLGPTASELSELMPEVKPIEKITFSCCGNDAFSQAIKALGRRQLLLTGIETHICVYQTAIDLLSSGFEVQVVTDAVSSRKRSNKRIGLERMKMAGAIPTSTEMALFELLRVAEGEKFREISKLVK